VDLYCVRPCPGAGGRSALPTAATRPTSRRPTSSSAPWRTSPGPGF